MGQPVIKPMEFTDSNIRITCCYFVEELSSSEKNKQDLANDDDVDAPLHENNTFWSKIKRSCLKSKCLGNQ